MQRARHTVPEEGEVCGSGISNTLMDCPWKIVYHIMFEREMFILDARNPPIEQIDIEALAKQVLHEAVAWYQVQDIRPIDEGIDQQDGNWELLLDPRYIVVEFGLVLSPDYLPGCPTRLNLRSLKDEGYSHSVLLEGTFNVGCRWYAHELRNEM